MIYCGYYICNNSSHVVTRSLRNRNMSGIWAGKKSRWLSCFLNIKYFICAGFETHSSEICQPNKGSGSHFHRPICMERYHMKEPTSSVFEKQKNSTKHWHTLVLNCIILMMVWYIWLWSQKEEDGVDGRRTTCRTLAAETRVCILSPVCSWV